MANATNWTHTTLQIMEEHYQSNLRDLQIKIQNLAEDDWEGTFKLAKKLAKRDLRRLKTTTIDQVKEKIIDIINNGPSGNEHLSQPTMKRSTTPPPQEPQTQKSINPQKNEQFLTESHQDIPYYRTV